MTNFIIGPKIDVDKINRMIDSNQVIVMYEPNGFVNYDKDDDDDGEWFAIDNIFVDSERTNDGVIEEVYGVHAEGRNIGKLYMGDLHKHLTVFVVDPHAFDHKRILR